MMQIRKVTHQDLEDVVAVRLALIYAYPSAFGDNPYGETAMDIEEWEEWLSLHIAGERSAVFLAYEDSLAVGMIYIHESSLDAMPKSPLIAEISDLGVIPDHTGKGIGRALVQEALAFAKATGINQVMLETWANNIPALELYTKLGFREQTLPQAQAQEDGAIVRKSIQMIKFLNK